MVVSVIFNTRLGYSAEVERHYVNRFSVPADWTETEVASFKFVPITDCSLQAPIFAIKRDIGSPGAPLFLHSFGLRLTPLLSVTAEVDQSRIIVHSDPHFVDFALSSFLFIPSLRSHRHKSNLSDTPNSGRYLLTTISVRDSNPFLVPKNSPGFKRAPKADHKG